ncbi:MAG: hypothetical protein JSS49_08285 [Planctomycetes bacterium]|nr:hypothetical protein [Planctomycetota bacterium]
MRRWLSLLGRLALIVSLWHAPLPMLHAHGTDIDDLATVETFVDHLVDYHPDVAINSHVDFGWHWHLVLPPVSHPGEDSSDGRCPCSSHDEQTLTQSQQVTQVLQEVCSWAATDWTIDDSVLSNPVVRVVTGTKFLDTYLGSVRLRTLLRVARC